MILAFIYLPLKVINIVVGICLLDKILLVMADRLLFGRPIKVVLLKFLTARLYLFDSCSELVLLLPPNKLLCNPLLH